MHVPLGMDWCPQVLNLTIPGTNSTWSQALANPSGTGNPVSYFRPDTGVALMPWIYTVGVIIIHLPMVLVRVTRWEIIQVWSLVFTAFTVVVVIQAYVSSKFNPAQILLWTPLMLVIDAGSMAQVFFLVMEARQNWVGERIVLSESEGPESSTLRSRLLRWWRKKAHKSKDGDISSDVELSPSGERNATTNGPNRTSTANTNEHRKSTSSNLSRRIRWFRNPAIFSATAAAILFFAVLALQLVGLAQAFKAYSSSHAPPPVSWCSPLFQPFGLAAVDSNCHVFPIAQSGTRGIGCIQIPGVWQQQWLTGTVVVTFLELFFEVIDVALLALVSTKTKIRGAKLKRPWATIFSGLAVLGVTLIFGIVYATTIPPQVGTRLTIAMTVSGRTVTYEGTLATAGLRGSLIGWNDGLFESWRRTYFGDPNY